MFWLPGCWCMGDFFFFLDLDLDLGIKSTQIARVFLPPMSMSLSVHKTARQLAVVCHWRSPGRELLTTIGCRPACQYAVIGPHIC
ncbi:uncharacterized protein PgNI_00856 [Pyricularia grisea]|uniref:Uncharacterized protein n=1 Tax=Pyricularia grisea TaxID=148305 RepID=A0A6P8BIF0_PYRGI|nr:uncharacterized protein PgNI_00856 [Pyricularia grisea]TLD16661.1 hypothetical protein PgNI_00856 [Pyricularia grisea]